MNGHAMASVNEVHKLLDQYFDNFTILIIMVQKPLLVNVSPTKNMRDMYVLPAFTDRLEVSNKPWNHSIPAMSR